MSSDGSITRWISQLQAGDHVAAQKLWDRYFERLVKQARKKLQAAPRRAADEEDVALSALGSFFRNAERGRFPQLADRNNLWSLLVVITARKAMHLVRDEQRQKRGGAARAEAQRHDRDPTLDDLVGSEPSPEFAAEVAEECQRLLQKLADADLEPVAVWKMEGYTTEEIARKVGCVPRTIERKLRLIRAVWEKEMIP